MKNLVIFFSFVSFLLIGCGSEEAGEQNDLPSIEEPTENQQADDQSSDDLYEYDEENPPSFTGEIVEIYGDDHRGATVESESAGWISVNLSNDEEWEVGDLVRVEFTGVFWESHPALIDQLSIEKIE